MGKQSRNELKEYFAAGKLPSASNFAELIDSMVNFIDDRALLEKLIKPTDTTNTDSNGQTQQSIKQSTDTGTQSDVPDEPIEDTEITNTDTQNDKPNDPPEDAQTIGSNAETYTLHVAANKEWHQLLVNLKSLQPIKIVAVVGNMSRHAVLHGICFAGSAISVQQDHKGMPWHKIALKWTGGTDNYNLEIKTKTNYGDDCDIMVNITSIPL